MKPLSEDNLVVHGLWIGERLSRLELLTIKSFVHFGHEFHLWLYAPLENIPAEGVVLRDAASILPESAIFRNAAADPISGVGKDSIGAFSDLFRYKLLAEHGGIWVDMDVTCLQPFDCADEYWFRAHRVGIIGNIMKCPAGSEVMQNVYAEAAAGITAASPWLAASELLSAQIAAHGLTDFVHEDLCNPDDWRAVRPMIDAYQPPPDHWVAIHWGNEFWRSFHSGAGTGAVLDKDAPPAGGLLHALYRFHGLIDPHEPYLAPPKAAVSLTPALPAAAAAHVNMLIPRLVRGGAERIALEISSALGEMSGCTATLFVRRRAQREFSVPRGFAAHVVYLDQMPGQEEDRFRKLALAVLASPSPLLFTHMVRASDLAALWRWGVLTVPVIHNAGTAWLDAPTCYDHQNVPFIIAVSETVAEELRGRDCPKPVVTLRHALQKAFDPRQMGRRRAAIRDQYGIGRNTLLIGMVGQFKTQKAYTRAVRVLAEMRGICDARLMILGGWDNGFGGGRTAYEAVCRLAVELGVIADMIMPGDVAGAEDYFAAFDVFLNTSIHEGLSIALLEAAASGCPIVAADAGGNRELMPAEAVLVRDGADIDAYVEGICRFLRQAPRLLPPRPPAPKLVPWLWALLARHASDGMVPALPVPIGTLFITGNLHIGGAQRSLVNLLEALPPGMKTALCILGGFTANAFAAALAQAKIPVLPLGDIHDRAEQAAICLEAAAKLNVATICFWNCPAEVKLIIAKILQRRRIRLIDVSPGPMLFDALAGAAEFQRRLAFDTAAYFRRLDHFVAKYTGGLPAEMFAENSGKTSIIPNGVKLPPRFVPLPPPALLLPRGFDPALAIGTCCRLVADKKLEFLIEMMAHLRRAMPGASLTVIGGPEGEDSEYYQALLAQLAALDDIRLAGAQDDIQPLLAQFKIFVMVSERQGCPNASLEAMAMGLPVIANRNGGIAEQVEPGINGFLVDTPGEMAMRVAELLPMPIRQRQFGAAGRRRAETRFSMALMARRYQELLEAPVTPFLLDK